MLPYSTAINTINSTSKYHLQLIDTSLTKLNLFQTGGIDFINCVTSSTNNITTDNHVINWIQKYAFSIDSLSIFIEMVTKKIYMRLKKYRETYINEINGLKDKLEKAKEPFEEANQNYFNAYQIYLEACHTIEKNASKMNSENQNIKEAAEMKFNEVRSKCPEYEEDAIRKMESLRLEKRKFIVQMEEIMINFEQIEKRFYQNFKETIDQFADFQLKLSNSYKTNYNESSESLKSIDENQGYPQYNFTKFEIPEKIKSVNESNLYESLSPTSIFSNEINSDYLITTKIYFAQTPEETELKKDDILQIIQNKKEYITIRNFRTKIIGTFNSSLLKELTSPYKSVKKIYKITYSTMVNDITIKTGEFVFVFKIDEKTASCITTKGEVISLPTNSIVEYNDL